MKFVLKALEIEVIELLAAANQASVTAMGWNSLHLLCAASGVSTSRLLEEIAKGPEEVSIADGNGRLPLHLAAASRQQTAVIEALLKHYPEGARVVDVLERPVRPGNWEGGGRTALHYAVAGKCPPGSVKMILDANPGAAKIRDENGSLPLHFAMKGCARAAVTLGRAPGE